MNWLSLCNSLFLFLVSFSFIWTLLSLILYSTSTFVLIGFYHIIFHVFNLLSIMYLLWVYLDIRYLRLELLSNWTIIVFYLVYFKKLYLLKLLICLNLNEYFIIWLTLLFFVILLVSPLLCLLSDYLNIFKYFLLIFFLDFGIYMYYIYVLHVYIHVWYTYIYYLLLLFHSSLRVNILF